MDYKQIQALKAKFEEVPGTYLFNCDRCRQGYHLNMFCSSMSKDENRKAFLADEKGYIQKNFPKMTAEQTRCVLERDWLGMIKSGANIYYMSKFGATLGRSFQYMAGEMTGQGQDQYRAMMMDGGRTTKGNLNKKDNGGKIRCISNKSGKDYSKQA
ncbi:MAG TPA: protocatechuate 4,5-dioxygenase subunit alpha [Candidatus Acidoferrum sp.]|nr:protocatechuate 4,5-dioxygenase subunit alpha [Candidatus Acidoferrum sp.]